MHVRYIKCNSKSVQVDMGELGRALCSFDESIPYLTSIKDELAVKVSAISSESSNIDEVSVMLFSSILLNHPSLSNSLLFLVIIFALCMIRN